LLVYSAIDDEAEDLNQIPRDTWKIADEDKDGGFSPPPFVVVVVQ
jgi:hypothetical protein